MRDIPKDRSASVSRRAPFFRVMDDASAIRDRAVLYHKDRRSTCDPSDYPWRRGIHAVPRIRHLNALIAHFTGREHVALPDYFTPLENARHGQKADLTRDGLHLNLKGYRALEPLTDRMIAQGLHP